MKTFFSLLLAVMIPANLYVLFGSGLSGFLDSVRHANGWSVLLTADLIFAFALVAAWIVRDARAHNRSPLPYLLLTVVSGSVGPLLYLLGRSPEGSRS